MLRGCIIGVGRIGSTLEKDPLRPPGSSHAGTYNLSREVALVAGADSKADALAEFGSSWAIPAESLYPDYQDMLDRERPDIVSICAYAPQRLEMALAALESGAKGLWLEKALGCSLREADQIEQALQRHKAAGVVDYPRRGRKHYRKVKQLIDDGTFGRLQSVTCHMTHQLIHTGTHAFDVLRYWCGDALEVRGTLESGSANGHPISDQGGSAEMLMSSGTRAFVSAYRKKYYIFQFDLIFDEARILLGNDIATVYQPATSKLYTGFKELFPVPNFDWGSDYPRDLLAELVHAMKTGDQPLFSVRDATETLRIALSIFESARRGGVIVNPAEIDPELRIENS
ncbi:Oxidoreductase family, NAD-binding Rossmann fold protein [Verrucomicrobiia bacterium DG1235]|nr:Oxidoreductase family, NAD-binding Rossmann fold protein [Verrucomicrobiae bacterium DG1235]